MKSVKSVLLQYITINAYFVSVCTKLDMDLTFLLIKFSYLILRLTTSRTSTSKVEYDNLFNKYPVVLA